MEKSEAAEDSDSQEGVVRPEDYAEAARARAGAMTNAGRMPAEAGSEAHSRLQAEKAVDSCYHSCWSTIAKKKKTGAYNSYEQSRTKETPLSQAKEQVAPGFEPGLPEGPRVRIWDDNHYITQPLVELLSIWLSRHIYACLRVGQICHHEQLRP